MEFYQMFVVFKNEKIELSFDNLEINLPITEKKNLQLFCLYLAKKFLKNHPTWTNTNEPIKFNQLNLLINAFSQE